LPVEAVEAQEGAAAVHELFPGAVPDSPFVADDDGGLLRAGHFRVQQVPVVHERVGFVDEAHDARPFAALAAMDGYAVSKGNILHALALDRDFALIEEDVKDVVFGVIRLDYPDRAIHHAEVVVVPKLDDLIVYMEFWPASVGHIADLDPVIFLLHELLEDDIQIVHPEQSLSDGA